MFSAWNINDSWFRGNNELQEHPHNYLSPACGHDPRRLDTLPIWPPKIWLARGSNWRPTRRAAHPPRSFAALRSIRGRPGTSPTSCRDPPAIPTPGCSTDPGSSPRSLPSRSPSGGCHASRTDVPWWFRSASTGPEAAPEPDDKFLAHKPCGSLLVNRAPTPDDYAHYPANVKATPRP